MTTSFGATGRGRFKSGGVIEPPLSLAAWRVALDEDAWIFLTQHQDDKILPSILVYLQYTQWSSVIHRLPLSRRAFHIFAITGSGSTTSLSTHSSRV